MISKKAQIERWIVIAIIAIIGTILLVYLFIKGLLPNGFGAIMGQLKAP